MSLNRDKKRILEELWKASASLRPKELSDRLSFNFPTAGAEKDTSRLRSSMGRSHRWRFRNMKVPKALADVWCFHQAWIATQLRIGALDRPGCGVHVIFQPPSAAKIFDRAPLQPFFGAENVSA